MSKFHIGDCVVVKRKNGRRIVGKIVKLSQAYVCMDGARVPADLTAEIEDGAGTVYVVSTGLSDVVKQGNNA